MAYPPFTPEEIERANAYYSGTPGVNMSPANPADYYGPPSPTAPAAPFAPGTHAPAEPPPLDAPLGVDPSWTSGAQAPSWTPPGPAPVDRSLEGGIRQAFAPSVHEPAPAPPEASPPAPEEPAPAPTVRQPISFERGPSAGVPRPSRPGGGGPGDYGAGKARGLIRGTYDEEKDALGRSAAAEQGKLVTVADRQADLAREKEEDAAIARLEADEAERGFSAYRAETQRQIDAVREKKIDGSRLFSDDGSRAAAIIGGMLGGLYMGINRLQSNPFIDQLNKMIDRDIALQEKELANQKEAVAERRSMLGEMRSSFKDNQLAKLQARNLYYEAMKSDIESQASRYDIPIVQARADQAISAITREQGKLDLDEATRKAANARAAAAAQAAATERARKAALEERKMRVEEGELILKAGKNGPGGKEFNDQINGLSKDLSKPEYVQAKKTIADLKRTVSNPETGEVDGSRRVPGTGPVADARASWWANPVGPGKLISGETNPITGLSPEERVGRQNWDRLFFAYRHAITGSGGSDQEMADIKKAFEGAGTAAEQANAIRQADAMLAEIESRVYAGYSPEVVSEYRRRMGEEHAARPKTVKREPVR